MGDVNFVSSLVGIESLPESYVLPPEKRPGLPVKRAIPIVDFTECDRAQKIVDAFQELGFFQVINHGVPRTLLEKAMRIFKEFHSMSPEDKLREGSKDPNRRSCKVFTSTTNYKNEQVHSWRDALSFNCYPLEKYVHFWPENPSNFREVVEVYCDAMRKLALEIVELISEAMGLGKGYLGGEFCGNPVLGSNLYPPCPNPGLTLGIKQHCDISIITILLQDMNGLQCLKNGEWIAVEPIDGALVVNAGRALQVICNEMLRSGEHRVVTNTKATRQSIAYHVHPRGDVIIEPAKCLTNEVNPQYYHSLKFNEFWIKETSDPLYTNEPVMQHLSSN